MDQLPAFHPSSRNYFFPLPRLFPHHFIPENHVRWTQTPDSHVYTAQIPGLRKEEIRVEVEDSRYLIIRTEAAAADPCRSFNRKFRLPGRVDVDGISAEYVDGVLRVKVPRRVFFIDPDDVPEMSHLLARAA